MFYIKEKGVNMKHKASLCNIVKAFNSFKVIYDARTSAIVKMDKHISKRIKLFLQNSNFTSFDDDISSLIKKGIIIPEIINKDIASVKQSYFRFHTRCLLQYRLLSSRNDTTFLSPFHYSFLAYVI